MLKEYLKIKLERLAILIMKVVQVFLDFQHNRRYSKKCIGSNHCFPIYIIMGTQYLVLNYMMYVNVRNISLKNY
jgi:hypothetical protein